jgi:hypothetical protein
MMTKSELNWTQPGTLNFGAIPPPQIDCLLVFIASLRIAPQILLTSLKLEVNWRGKMSCCAGSCRDASCLKIDGKLHEATLSWKA